jgi:asparagine synthase (glutamine-hydrolysing)
MCGILGLVGTPWQSAAHPALDSIANRGPDDYGLFERDGVVLGHRRLSVIDLATGHQPMATPDGRLVIVFNGEIYNFQALRDELERAGYRFVTQSDTEVLLHGFAAWGRALLPRLDGMFAFAIWDTAARRLFAARDRMGIKPFMYCARQGFAFASTLAPFLAIEGFPRRVDPEGLRDYLAFQTPLAPRTLLADVSQLQPAHWLEFHAGSHKLATGAYWSIPAPDARPRDRAQLIERVDTALASAVKKQLVAEVPIGAFLSGGIDSSLMVHYMANAGASPLTTFSVRFREASLDETAHAQTVAALYGTTHEVFDAPALDAGAFEHAIDALDQPLADPAYVPTLALSRLTRSQVTVAISGDGGDEVFGGYPRFRDQESDHPRRAWQPMLRKLIDLGIAPGSALRRTLSGQELLRYRKVELGPYPGSRKSLRDYLSPAAWQACRPEATLERWLTLARSFGGRLDSGALMRADLWTYLSENCLAKTDRASMAWSLEVRVPMLGNDVLDAVLDAPAAVHFDPEGKALLRALAKRYLPESVWNRPKHGFSVPVASYLRGPWRTLCEQWLAEARMRASFLDAEAVGRLWADALAGRASVRLAYTFVVLLGWLSRHRLSL